MINHTINELFSKFTSFEFIFFTDISGVPKSKLHQILKKILIKITFTAKRICKANKKILFNAKTHSHNSPQKNIDNGISKNDIKLKNIK